MASRPTSRPSTANQRPIAPTPVPTTHFQSSHKTSAPRHPRHCLATNPDHPSGESRVCPGPSRPGSSRIRAIDVDAEPLAAFYAYFSPNTINEKLVYACGENSMDNKKFQDGQKSASQILYLPLPITSKNTYKPTKPNGCVPRARRILIVALLLLCMYNYYPLALSLPYIIYARYNISHSG